MTIEGFEQAVRQTFGWLCEGEGCRLTQPEPPSTQRTFMVYRNEHAFVTFRLDFRERLFLLELGPLIGDEIPPYPIFQPKPDEPIGWYPLWAVMAAVGEAHPGFSFDDDRLLEDLQAHADALRRYGTPLLRGDADSLPDIRAILAENRRERRDEPNPERAARQARIAELAARRRDLRG